MYETLTIRLVDEEKMKKIASSMKDSLYKKKCTISLTGELGAGKTTWTQSFLQSLGIEENIVSPTFAIEQRYSVDSLQILHADLYRLDESSAEEIAESSEDFEGIRVIEWAERVPGLIENSDIHIHIEEDNGDRDNRTITISFNDCILPEESDIESWREDVLLPDHIVAHCEKVGEVAEKLASILIEQGTLTRPKTMRIAGKLHDLLRFVDFRDDQKAHYPNDSEKQRETWSKIRALHEGKYHEAACAEFLIEKEYPDFAEIIRTHGLSNQEMPTFETTEQKLLFYADKRVRFDDVVTVEERFQDFLERYNDGKESELSDMWLASTIEIEKELFGDPIENSKL